MALAQQLTAAIGDLESAPNNVVKLLSALISPMQTVEDTLMALLTHRQIDTAAGEQLNVLGRIVGQVRAGLDDETFRRMIRARIATNRSSGVTEDLVKIAKLIVFDDSATYYVHRDGTATVRLRVDGVALTDDLGALLFAFERLAASGGVRLVVQWGDSAPSGWFRFDTAGLGFDQGHLTRLVG